MAGQPREPESTSGVPRWVKVLGVIAVLLLVAFVIVQVTGVGGGHGPGRHLPGGSQEVSAPAVGGPTLPGRP